MSTTEANATSAKRVAVKGEKHLYRRGDKYFLIVRVKGRLICKALKARTKTEAKTERDIELGKIKEGKPVAAGDKSLTFDALAAKWLEHERGPASTGDRRASTLTLRETLLRKHVSPRIGKRKAASLTAPELRELRDKLVAKELSGSSIRGVFASISCVFAYGIEYGHVSDNPARAVQLPSGQRKTEPRYLRATEVRRLLDGLGEEFRPVAACCFYAALRISEALALTWADVDFDKRLIYVRQGKTKASVAPVRLLPELADELKAHRERQGARLDRIVSTALVFQTFTGQPQSRRNALRAINRAGEKAKLQPEGSQPIGAHDLRHSCATYLREELGLRIKDVSGFLRHANESVTLQVYDGRLGTDEEQAVELGDKIERARLSAARS